MTQKTCQPIHTLHENSRDHQKRYLCFVSRGQTVQSGLQENEQRIRGLCFHKLQGYFFESGRSSSDFAPEFRCLLQQTLLESQLGLCMVDCIPLGLRTADRCLALGSLRVSNQYSSDGDPEGIACTASNSPSQIHVTLLQKHFAPVLMLHTIKIALQYRQPGSVIESTAECSDILLTKVHYGCGHVDNGVFRGDSR